MKTPAALAAACAFLALAPLAHARSPHRSLNDARLGSARPELVAQAAFSKAVLGRLTAPQARWKLALRHRSCWSHVPWSLRCDHARRQLLRHRRLLRLADARLARFHPRLPRWMLEAFTCIHHYEGAWDANTGNGYYGGLQMDRRFQSLYGSDYIARWGTADNWPAWAQLNAARRAHDSGRGFYPWPNTARACGLIS